MILTDTQIKVMGGIILLSSRVGNATKVLCFHRVRICQTPE